MLALRHPSMDDLTNKQNTNTKPTPVEMAKQAMVDMKTRIDLLRSHKENINRLVQTVQGVQKPLFLFAEIEQEEARLRTTRTALNLWIQQFQKGVTMGVFTEVETTTAQQEDTAEIKTATTQDMSHDCTGDVVWQSCASCDFEDIAESLAQEESVMISKKIV